jgi:hypothetical protein
MQLLAPYAPARERLNDAIAAQTKVGEILFNLADLADQLGLDPTVSRQFREAAQPGSSQRFIWQSSPTKAISLKLGNFSFEFGALSEFVTGVIATASKDVLGEANLILRAAGVLMLIRSLYAATAIKLDEREATVFGGFVTATKKAGDGVTEKVILAHTNKVRHSVRLQPLDRQELGNALYKLSEIKSVERVEGTTDMWRIIEKHHLKRFREENCS